MKRKFRSVSMAAGAVMAIACSTLLAGPASAADRFVTVGGGGTGGTYYIVAAAIANLLEKNMPSVKATARISTGTLENTRLVGRGNAEFGLAGSSGPWAAAIGEDPFQKERYNNIRYVMTGYSSTFQMMVPAESPIKTVADFKGKRIGIVSGTTVTTWLPNVAEAYGVKGAYQGFALNPTELVDSLRDGNIDALVFAGAAPNPGMSDLAASKPMRFLSLDTEKAKAIEKLMPYWVPATMKKTMYPNMPQDVLALDAPNILMTHDKVPEDIVYGLVKAMVENQDALKAIHPLAAEFNLENVGRAMVVPPHPGAARYFKEKGINLPAS